MTKVMKMVSIIQKPVHWFAQKIRDHRGIIETPAMKELKPLKLQLISKILIIFQTLWTRCSNLIIFSKSQSVANIEWRNLLWNSSIYIIQKQSPEVFCKKCYSKFWKIHRRTPVQQTLFTRVAGLRSATLLKKRLWHRGFPLNFEKYLRTSTLFLQKTSGGCLWL